MIIAGFALQLSTTITCYPENVRLLCELLVSSFITVLGWYILLIFIKRGEIKHKEFTFEHGRNLFIKFIDKILQEIELETNKSQYDGANFEGWKNNKCRQARNYLSRISDELAESIQGYLMQLERSKELEIFKHILIAIIKELDECY